MFPVRIQTVKDPNHGLQVVWQERGSHSEDEMISLHTKVSSYLHSVAAQ